MNACISLLECAARCNNTIRELSVTWQDVAVFTILGLCITGIFACVVYAIYLWKQPN